jgi:hypothetical protein
MVQHIVVQLPNRPGELAHLARALAARGINLIHAAAAGSGSIAFAYLETDRFDEACAVLRGSGYQFLAGHTIVVERPDAPGALADLAEELAAAGINIEGVMTCGHSNGKVDLAITVDDVEKARVALRREELVAV